MSSVLAFSVLVSGVLFDPRLDKSVCTCNSSDKTICSIAEIPVAQDHWKMIILLDFNQNPAKGKVNVICLKERMKS